MSVIKYLEKEYGGKWKYSPSQKAWNCNDGKSYVIRTRKNKSKLEIYVNPNYQDYFNSITNRKA